MIFISGKGGFGNQLYHLFFALFLKQHYQTDIYFILHGNPHQQYEIKQIFDIFPKTKQYINYADETFLKTIKSKYSIHYFNDYYYTIKDLPALGNRPIIFKITAYLEIEKMFNQLKPNLRDTLQINPDLITEEVDYLGKQDYAMIHIRYGDKLCRSLKNSYGETLLKRPFDHFPVFTPKYYLDMIEKIQKQHKIRKVYLISDSNELVKKYILNPANKNKTDPVAFLLDIPYWEAFHLLTKAKILVNSLSTFSYGAAYLNQTAKKKDIYQLIRKEARPRHDDQAISQEWAISDNQDYLLNYDQQLVKEMVDFYGKCQEYEDWYRKNFHQPKQQKPYQKQHQKPKRTVRNICCAKLFIKPLFPYISKGEYMEPIRQWIDHFGDDYHRQLFRENKKTDEVMLRYIQCRPRMRAVIASQAPSRKVNVVHKKPLTHLSSQGLKALLFQLDSLKDLELAQENLTKSPSQPLTAYFYEVNETALQKDDFPGAVYSAGWFLETIVTAKLTLHRNNRFQLEHADLDRFVQLSDSLIKLSTFLYQLYQNYSQLEIEQLHLASGVLALSIGAREISDIDVNVLPAKNDKNNKHLLDLPNLIRFEIDLQLMDNFKEKRKYLYRESLKHLLNYPNNTKSTTKSTTKTNTKSPTFYDLYHPRAYYYFYGLKLETFQITYTIWRYWRNRPKSVAELVFIADHYDIKFPIAEIPKVKIMTHGQKYLTYPMIGLELQLGELTEEEVKKREVPFEEEHFLRVVSRYLDNVFNYHLSNEKIKAKIEEAPKDPHDYPTHLF